MIAKLAMTALLAALVSACASSSAYWHKDGASSAEFERTRAKCDMGVAALPQSANEWDQAAREHSYFTNCMIADGWTLMKR